MHAGMSPHIVLLTRIGEEIGLRARLDTGIEERQTMLWHYRIVVVTGDNLQLALQVLRLVEKARLLITLGVVLGGTHIAFAIHHLIPFPVDDGTTGHTDLEDVRIVRYQRLTFFCRDFET